MAAVGSTHDSSGANGMDSADRWGGVAEMRDSGRACVTDRRDDQGTGMMGAGYWLDEGIGANVRPLHVGSLRQVWQFPWAVQAR